MSAADDEQIQAEVTRLDQERQMRRMFEEAQAMRRGEFPTGSIGVGIDHENLRVSIAIDHGQAVIYLSAEQARDLHDMLNKPEFADPIKSMAEEAGALRADARQLELERLREQAARVVAGQHAPGE